MLGSQPSACGEAGGIVTQSGALWCSVARGQKYSEDRIQSHVCTEVVQNRGRTEQIGDEDEIIEIQLQQDEGATLLCSMPHSLPSLRSASGVN